MKKIIYFSNLDKPFLIYFPTKSLSEKIIGYLAPK
jgi:hypothetical protein